MRTDPRRSAGRDVPGFDRPLWEESAASDEADTAVNGVIGYPGMHDTSPRAAALPPPTSGRHQAQVGGRLEEADTGFIEDEADTGFIDDEADTGFIEDEADTGFIAEELEAEDPPRTARASRRRGDLVRTGIRGLGQILITGGLVVLLFVVYELFITDVLTGQRQEELTDELLQEWEDDPVLGPDLPGGGLTEIPLGEGFAFIRIPALGSDYVRVVVEGTSDDALRQGPGHYVQSAMPGELGNFALAGHRTGKGSPFLNLDLLKPGDAVVIETVDTYFTYRVLGDAQTGDFGADPSGIPGQEIVSPQDVQVVFPIPGVDDGSVAPTSAYLTLTTCHPKFSNAQRLIIHAVLEGPGLLKVDYPDGPPAMLET